MPRLEELSAALRGQISSAHETDLGDFKRRALLYLNRFAEEAESRQAKKEAGALKDFILRWAPPPPEEGQRPQDALNQGQGENIELLRALILKKLRSPWPGA